MEVDDIYNFCNYYYFFIIFIDISNIKKKIGGNYAKKETIKENM